MVFRFEEGETAWIDLENPTSDEVRAIALELDLGGRILDELISPTPIPRLIHEDSAILLVLHFPEGGSAGGVPGLQEVDFVVGKRFILTVRYEVVAPIHELRRLLETGSLLRKTESICTEALVELLLNHLFVSVRDYASHAGKRLARIERDLFASRERSTIQAISELNGVFLHLEAALASHEAPLTLFLRELGGARFFGHPFTTRESRITIERTQTLHLIETLRAIATEARETNAGLLNARQNEIMKVLTIMAFVTFPLSLIAAIFGMETVYLPIVGTPGDFWIILGLMGGLTVSFFIFFRLKGWF